MRSIIAGIVAGILAWQVVTGSGAAYLAEVSPKKALALWSNQATALLNLADQALVPVSHEQVESDPQAGPKRLPKDRRSSGDVGGAGQANLPTSKGKPNRQTLAKIQSLAEQALAIDPLNARAMGILGELAILAADEKRADTFMRAAVRHSLFQTDAVDWLMRKNYRNKNFGEAMEDAGILLRTRQHVMVFVMPVLGKIAEDRSEIRKLRRLLVSNPAWRLEFFQALPDFVTDARTPLVLYLDLKNTAAPPTVSEISSYINFLVDHKFYDLAYYTWLQFLPQQELTKVGNLYNGNFEFNPSGMPFDWVWMDKPGSNIKIAAASDPERGRALHIELGPGRVDLPSTSELVMLPPGSYQLRGSYNVDVVSQRGLQWQVACAGREGSPLGKSSPVTGRSVTWKDFMFSFEVPATDCNAQKITLVSGARSASEQLISGTVEYDDLKIVNETVVTPTSERL